MGFLGDIMKELRSNADGMIVDNGMFDLVSDDPDCHLEQHKQEKLARLSRRRMWPTGEECVSSSLVMGVVRGYRSVQPMEKQSGQRLSGRQVDAPAYGPGHGGRPYNAGHDCYPGY